jgi:hypothetical protein
VSPGTRRHRYQAIGAFLDRLARETFIDNVMQHDAAIGMDRLIDVLSRPEGGDDQRHAIFHAEFDVVFQPGVRSVNDLIDRKGCGELAWMCRIMRREFLLDAGEPFIEQGGRAGIQRRAAADDARLALGDRQAGVRDDEQRRSDDRQRQPPLETWWNGHG